MLANCLLKTVVKWPLTIRSFRSAGSERQGYFEGESGLQTREAVNAAKEVENSPQEKDRPGVKACLE